MKTNTAHKLILFLAVAVLISCKKEDSKPSSTTPPPSTGTSEANIILTAGGEEFKIIGPCGWASAGGTKYIGANHATNSQRVFATYFNIDTPPTQTTTYTLVEDYTDTDPTHITMNIVEIKGDTLTEWNSTLTSGSLTLVVEGNKISANLNGISLTPGTSSGIFVSGNTGNFSNTGFLTGTLVFYQ